MFSLLLMLTVKKPLFGEADEINDTDSTIARQKCISLVNEISDGL